jgi:hypothetical protein
MHLFYYIAALTSSATAITQSGFATHAARQLTNSEGGHIEQTAASLDLPSVPTPTRAPGPLSEVGGVDNNITSWAWLWGWHGCSNGQKNAILNGLKEANTVLGTDGVYNIDKHWNDFATVEFFGSPSRMFEYDQLTSIRGACQVHLQCLVFQTLMPMLERFERAYQYQQSWFSWYDTQVYCSSDLENVCTKELGYIWVANGGKNDYLALSFCDRYFRLGTLQDIYDESSKGDRLHDLGSYENRARAWITAMMRINWIRKSNEVTYQFITYDGRKRLAESSSEAKYLAKSNGGYKYPDVVTRPFLNPSNYAWYALAQWVQEKSGDYPQEPYGESLP